MLTWTWPHSQPVSIVAPGVIRKAFERSASSTLVYPFRWEMLMPATLAHVGAGDPDPG
jgi:hypothetical protein